MNRILLIISALTLCLYAVDGHSANINGMALTPAERMEWRKKAEQRIAEQEERQQKENQLSSEEKVTELAFILEMFMPKKGNNHKEIPWDTQSENREILWDKSGLSYQENTILRKGKIFLTVNGRQYYKLADRKIPLPWNIVMIGDKFGVSILTISPHADTWGTANSGSDFEIRDAIKANKNLRLMLGIEIKQLGQSTAFYVLSCEGKEDLVLEYVRDSGSGGESNSLSLFYTVDPHPLQLKKFALYKELQRVLSFEKALK